MLTHHLQLTYEQSKDREKGHREIHIIMTFHGTTSRKYISTIW